MFHISLNPGSAFVVAQGVIGIATIALAAVAPPVQGRMLVVPLWTAGQGDAVRIALGNGARLVDQGPLARSIVVDGDRDRLAGPMIAAGMGLVSTHTAGCGQEARS